MREYGVEGILCRILAVMDQCAPQHPAALTRLFDLHGAEIAAHEKHPAPNRIGLAALRSNSEPLHQSDDGRHLWSQNFRNEIVWKRTTAHSDSKRAGRIHDTLLFYTASDTYTWNKVYQPYDEEYVEKCIDTKTRTVLALHLVMSPPPVPVQRDILRGSFVIRRLGRTGGSHKKRLMSMSPLAQIFFTKNGFPRYKRYLKEMKGVALQDIWADRDVQPVVSWSNEGFGYPTQKPVALLDRIIRLCSNKGEVVFDPFCGCGTTIYAAVNTDRKWIGCDIAVLAIKLIREVLSERYHLVEGVHYDVDGIPVSVEQAQELFHHDPFQFQHWLVERIGGFPMQKKVADKGIDGRMYFETKDELKCMVLSVKGGKIRPTDLRDLRGVLEREPDTELAGFLCLQEPTKAMLEAAVARRVSTNTEA